MPEPTPPESDSVEAARDELLDFIDRLPAHEHMSGRVYFNDCKACLAVERRVAAETAVVERERTLHPTPNERMAVEGEAALARLDAFMRERTRAEAAEAALEAKQEALVVWIERADGAMRALNIAESELEASKERTKEWRKLYNDLRATVGLPPVEELPGERG